MSHDNAVMHAALLCLGANVPSKRANICSALAMLQEAAGSIEASSGLYAYPAINGRDPDYVNAVVLISTPLALEQLVAACKRIESELGRTPMSKSRGLLPADIDVVEFDNNVVSAKECDMPYFTHGRALMTTITKKNC